MVIFRRIVLTLMVVSTPALADHVPGHPIDAQPCGEIEGQPGAEISYCLWPGPAPLLVLLSALGKDSQSWSRAFVETLAGFAGVLVYDRRGYGQSAASAQPISAETTAADLEGLLRGLAIAEPVLLVGHALGGLYAQYYARRYPRRVAAVVLIETTSPFAPVDDPRFWTHGAVAAGNAATLEREGITRAIVATRSSPAFPPVPLLVLTAADQRPPDFERRWREIQAQTAAQSPLGRQLLVRGSGLEIQDQQPALVAAQIRDLWLGLARDR
jgi:pimeloyl-ACP methyl ester carboxylesterase